MAYFLFVDESGQDHRESPYEVLAGVAVEDRDLWNLVKALQEAELRYFGMSYSTNSRELKAKKLLNKKTYRLANQLPLFPEDQCRSLAKQCLENGVAATRDSLTALAQAKLAYVREAFNICSRFRCRVFASIIDRNSPSPNALHLRKDYAYLFERFFYFLEDKDTSLSGIIVFDELEKSQSHILIEQMDRYFKYTARGKRRAGQIIPEPFFVHSDLTTGIQLADLSAYIASWNVRFEGMNEPRRSELDDLTEQLLGLRYRAIREVDGNPNYPVWSFAVITDLRAREDRTEI
ncbi:hypothetical protein Nos7524_0398 [Nostoc sp. PCC 7524]|uniref:DUF3800 domain-containing protein n=1 Tax=Nostoc sp. (strain ATCC 29411 / PCC 7524) TaxID=28072 RepID=UPI00029F2818|nr:DUF3800 domain-containing protein [Nostoc sp. PCC 7524]AFY46313.1 hypothetical protein Nos7524_0398 [Nostoc sp. PCC 7524]